MALAESITLPAYGLLSARLEFTDPSEWFSVVLFAMNITDEEYCVGGCWLSPVGSRHVDWDGPAKWRYRSRYGFERTRLSCKYPLATQFGRSAECSHWIRRSRSNLTPRRKLFTSAGAMVACQPSRDTRIAIRRG